MSSTDLNNQLRYYSAQHVKIQESDYEWAKSLVEKYVKDELWNYIRENSEFPLQKLEYTGSHYERLKTEAADEVDVMLVLDAKKHITKEEVEGVPGWVKLKVHKTDSPFNNKKYVNPHQYILPEKMLSKWLFSIVTRARNAFQEKATDLAVSFEVRKHGPAVQLDITEVASGKTLSVDLVLAFGFDDHEFYVAKPYKIKNPNKRLPCNKDILLRKSFSTREKAKLKSMDNMDSGCRHELLRIVKTIVRNDSALKGKLTTYHLKTAFLWFNQDESKSWHRNELGNRFLDYIQYLVDALKQKNLPNFWVHEVNLLEDIEDVVIGNMVGRLQRLLSSDNERSKILKVPTSDLPTLTSQLSIKEEGILDLLRTFIDDMGNALSKSIRDSRELFNKYVKDVILKRCKENYPDLISNFEYSGNLYEKLMTEDQDEDVVILMVLKKKSNDVIHMMHEGYYSKFKVQGKRYESFSDSEGFVSPEKMRKWFFTIVREEAESCAKEFGLDIKISQPAKNSPLKLDIKISQENCQEKKLCLNAEAASNVWFKTPSIRVCLLPAFELVKRKFFVPIEPYHFEDSVTTKASNNWKQSFSLEMKNILQQMDTDGGCRHDLYKVVNTILKREPTFSYLLPHMKMLFVKFIKDSTKNWDKSKLGDKFEEFFSFLAGLLENKKLKHFWLDDVDLLSNVPTMTLENMEKRVKRILSSDQEKQKILKY
ncbi:uncharacterized protein LOC116292926 isoform X2 [Actinia tenebrosa]|nr:uncharacterized protein LOC116292926 isoform X2 [Actinia tenebrosa]